jgi:hypothetical protein
LSTTGVIPRTEERVIGGKRSDESQLSVEGSRIASDREVEVGGERGSVVLSG